MQKVIIFISCFISLIFVSKAEVQPDSTQKKADKWADVWDISPVIEIWSHTGNDYLIHPVYEKPHDEYIQIKEGWSIHGPYPPKKFDVKLLLINDIINESGDIPENKPDVLVSIKIKYRASENADSQYMRNPIETKEIEILKNRLVRRKNLNRKSGVTSFFVKDVEYEKCFTDFEEKGYCLSQIIFFITLTDARNQKKYLFEHTSSVLK